MLSDSFTFNKSFRRFLQGPFKKETLYYCQHFHTNTYFSIIIYVCLDIYESHLSDHNKKPGNDWHTCCSTIFWANYQRGLHTQNRSTFQDEQ